MKQYHVTNLILEVTRRCNMNCAHCLRGNAKAVDMSPEVLKATMGHIDSICDITFTGGEPSLNLPIIAKTLEICKSRHMNVSSVFIATNGLANVDCLLKICDKWHEYMTCPEIGNDKLISPYEYPHLFQHNEDDEGFGMQLALSSDRFHAPIPASHVLKLKSRTYFSTVKMFEDNDRHVLSRGRGIVIPDAIDRPIQEDLYFDEYDENVTSIEELYVTATGDILADCDIPYNEHKKYRLDSVFDTDCLTKLEEKSERT